VQDLDALENLPLPRSKAELMERIPPARGALESVLSGLSEVQLVAPGSEGWSIKDHLAHLATWERMIVAHLQGGNDHEVVGLDEATYVAASLDALNAIIEQRNKGRSLGDVLNDFQGSHVAIVALLYGLTDADLARPYWDNDPTGRTALDKVTGDTYRHYLEHRRWINELLTEVSAAEETANRG
jgi:hypothetical protein